MRTVVGDAHGSRGCAAPDGTEAFIAQLAEHGTFNPRVAGSSPAGGLFLPRGGGAYRKIAAGRPIDSTVSATLISPMYRRMMMNQARRHERMKYGKSCIHMVSVSLV
jgi:hypothetical protein